MADISKLREKIDAIDCELIKLFKERMNVSNDIAEYKREHGLPVYDGKREQEVIKDRVLSAPKEYSVYVEQLMRLIVDLSKHLQNGSGDNEKIKFDVSGKVAFQGIRGAYSEEALIGFFEDNVKTKPVAEFEDVFISVLKGETQYGIIPVENSASGSVIQSYDLLNKYDVYVVGEYILPIRHALLGIPGADLSLIKEVFSHEQGLMQCSDFLSEHKEWIKTPKSNTAISAKYVADLKDKSKAAIASRYAGKIYGLSVLKDNISNTLNNVTRFFIIGAKANEKGFNKASILFSLKHETGSLAKALTLIAAKGYNLTKIESRPILGQNWHYRFYVDLEGNLAKLSTSIKEMEEYCTDIKVLGVYSKMR
ncbi:MAG: bifunctional chorismate mutase/prephenate dehydratase [Eubacteriales bacterium]